MVNKHCPGPNQKSIKQMIRIYLLLGFILCSTTHAQVDVIPPPAAPLSLAPPQADYYGVDNGIAAFISGFAKVIQNRNTYYIDANGTAVFDYIKDNGRASLGNKYSIEEYQKQLLQSDRLPWAVLDIVKQGKYGVLSPAGDLILPPIYDEIDRVGTAYWMLSLDGKKTYYLPHKKWLPFFDDIGYLDGRYFDVQQQGKWGIYDAKEGKMVIQAHYDAFDYCGGCSKTANYVYASKNAKWGIINWQEKVLVPFQYDHQHRNMRSDNWVQSFAKNGQAVVVNIVTNKELEWNDASGFINNNLLVYKKDGKYGIYNKEGELQLPFIYDKIENPNDEPYATGNADYFVVKQGNLSGVIDADGQVIIPLSYDAVRICLNHFIATKADISYLLDKNNNLLLTVPNATITAIHEGECSNTDALPIFKVKQRAYWGIYFATTHQYYEPQFYDVTMDHQTSGDSPYWIVADSQGVKTVFDAAGTLVLPALYNGYTVKKEFPEHLIQVKQQQAIGIYDTKLKREFIPTKYADYFDVIGTRKKAIICRSGDYTSTKIELRDWNGQRITNHLYTDIISLDSISYLLTDVEQSRYALYKTDSGSLTHLPYKQIELIGSNKVVAVRKDKAVWSLYHTSRLKELPGSYLLQSTTEDLPASTENIPLLHYFRNGMGLISLHNKNGFIDEDGKQIFKPMYDFVKEYNSAGIAFVGNYKDNERTIKGGYIDKKGKFLLPLQDINYDDIDHNNTLASMMIVSKEDPNKLSTKKGLINSKGKVLIDVLYDDIFAIKDSKYIVVLSGKKYGFLDDKGNWLIKPEYDDLGVMSYHFDTYYFPNQLFPMPVKKDGKWFYLTASGDFLKINGENLIY